MPMILHGPMQHVLLSFIQGEAEDVLGEKNRDRNLACAAAAIKICPLSAICCSPSHLLNAQFKCPVPILTAAVDMKGLQAFVPAAPVMDQEM